jgi:gluconokinase
MKPKPVHQANAIVLMGVSGCGKTSVGITLSKKLGWPFFDGDNFHPPENIAKMSQGVPLDDEDRYPWLTNLNQLIGDHLRNERSLLLACSALKQSYRDQLAKGNPGTLFVHLKGDFDLINTRMQDRPGHYMKAEMLRSQFETLEEPDEALVIDIGQNLDSITEEIIVQLHLSKC